MKVPARSITSPSKKKPLPRDASSAGPFRSPVRDRSSMDASRKQDIAEVVTRPWWDQQADCSDSIPDAFLHDDGAQLILGTKSGHLVPSIGHVDGFPCSDADQDHSDYLQVDGGTQRSPRKPSRPIQSLSQSSGHSQEELCFAEVNPVTFELAPNIALHEAHRKESCEKWGHFGRQDITATLSEISSSHNLIGNCFTLSMPEGPDEHPTTHQAKPSSTAKLICSFGGKIMPRPVDGKLRYVGGETRIVTVYRSMDLNGFLSKMMQYYGLPLRFKYQLPGEDLDALISVSSDEDWQNMMEEHDKIESSGGLSRLRLFFFTSPAELEVQQAGLKNEADDGCVDLDHRFINAVNGMEGKFCTVGLDDEGALPRVSESLGRPTHYEVANARTYLKGPSLPPSAPSSPPYAPRHETDLKSVGVDSSLHISSDHLSKVMIKPHGYEGDVNQDGSGSSSGISYYDQHYHVATDSPRMALHDVAIPRCENWQVSETGMHRVDSKSRLIHQSEHQTELQLDRRTPFAYPEQRSHMQQPSEMLLTPGESQHFFQHHKQNLQQQQQQPLLPAWQSQMKGNVGRVETPKHALSDMHKQHHILPQSHHQAAYRCLHHVAGCDGNAWNAEHFAGPSFYQGSRQGHGQIPPGLSPAPPYQIGADASSPRALTSDYLGRCSCGQQHSHVHRGISVSIGDQPHMRRPPHFPDQPLRKHGLNSSSRFLDSCSHCGEPHVWHQHGHFGGTAEIEQGEQLWQQANGRHIPENHIQEVRSKNRIPSYHDTAFAETLLASNGRLDSNKSKYTCSECHDPRVHEKVMLHQGYTDTQNKAVNIAMQLRHGEPEGLNDPFSKRLAFEHIPYKDGETRQGFEEDKFVGGQSCFGVSQAGGDHGQKRTQAMPVELMSQHGNFSTYAVPVSRPPIIENPHVSLAAGQVQSQWRSNVTDSWALSSLDPRLCSDVIPSAHVHTVNEADSATFGTPISSHISDFMLTHRKINNSSVIGQPTENHGQGHGAAVAESFKWEKNSRSTSPITVVGEAEVGPSHVSPVYFDMACSECDVKVPAMHGSARLSGVDGIPAGRLVPLRTTPAVSVTGLAAPAATLSMAMSPNSPASPVYDQSPLSSTNSTEFCFGQNGTGCIQDAFSKDEAALTSGMSLTGQLADGMISSILNSDQGPSRSSKNADLKVDHMQPKQVVVNTINEKAAGSLTKEENATSTPITEQDRSWSVAESSTVNGWLKVGTDESQLAREALMVLNGATDELTDGVPQVNGDETDDIFSKETEESASSQAEAEARARGLQIIKNADLEELKELGSGTFGTVFHGKWRGSDVAIKRIKASCFMGSPSQQERLIADFWKEACTLAQLHHPNIVAFYGVVPDGPGGTLATVTEYMVNGSLKQVLHKKDRTIDRRKRLFIAMDAAFGMEYLHSKQIVHFDLKCENLLVNMRDAHRPICKVGDFGLSKVKHNTLVSGGVRGTLPWMAPELLSGNCGMVSNKVDVYSFGIVMWELLTGEEPYANMHCGEIIGGIVNNTLRLTIPSWCDPGWRSLMERCWSHDPSDRPAFSDVAKGLREIAASMNIK